MAHSQMVERLQQRLNELYDAERMRLISLSLIRQDGDYTNPVFGKGPFMPKLMLIGEAPGAQEAKLGQPFVGKAGRQLDEMLGLAGISRTEIFVTNAVKYRPIKKGVRGACNRTPGRQEINESRGLLSAELELIAPVCIATLGNTPLTAICGVFGEKLPGIGEIHGQLVTFKHNTQRLFPLYHPAASIYDRSLAPLLKADMCRLGELLNEIAAYGGQP